MIAAERKHEGNVSNVHSESQQKSELEKEEVSSLFKNTLVEPDMQLITGRLMREQLDFEVQERSNSQFGFDCESSTLFIESAMALDLLCLETVESVENIIKICHSPIEIKNFEGSVAHIASKQHIFLWMIEEAITNSYQMLNLQNDFKKWNSTIKRRLKLVENDFYYLNQEVKKMHTRFSEVEKLIIHLGNNIKQSFSGNINAAATLNGKYANKKFNEVVQPRESKWRKKKIIRFKEESSEHSLHIRLSLGCLTLRTDYVKKWTKFKSITCETDRKFFIDVITNEFLTAMSTSMVILHDVRNLGGNDRKDFGIGRILEKLEKISKIFEGDTTFWPKEKTFMLQEWIKAEVGIDFLFSKIKLLYNITNELESSTYNLFKSNFLEFVGENGRSTLPLDKFSSVEIKILGTDLRTSDILRKYICMDKSVLYSEVLAKPSEENSVNETTMGESKGNDETRPRSRPITVTSSDSSYGKHKRRSEKVILEDENNVFKELENMDNEYKTALEELQKTEIIEDRHLSLCCDKVKMFYDKIIILHKTIHHNTKILNQHSRDIFNLEDSTLNQRLLGYLGVTFQSVKNCDFKKMSSSEKVGFQNLIEELVRNIRKMLLNITKYRETLIDDRQQLRDYIGAFSSLDSAFAQNRSENEWKLQQTISLTISKMKQRGSVKNSLRFLTGSDCQSTSKYQRSERHSTEDESHLFTEMKLNQLLTSISIFSNSNGNVKKRKELPNYYNECQMKIMNLCVSHLSDMCNYISSNLTSMLSSIYLHHDVKSVRTSMKPDKNFLKLHSFEKYVVFTALHNSEFISTEHWVIFLQFEQLLGNLVIIFEMLKKLVIQNGMIERESKIILENRITNDELDWLSILSVFGVDDFEDMCMKIQEMYEQTISNEMPNVENISSSTDSSVSESQTSSVQLSTIDNIFSRFIMKEEIHKPLGINVDKILVSKLKMFEELITGKLSNILGNLNHPKVSQTQNEDTPYPVGYVSIFSFLTCITSLKIKFPSVLNNELKDNLKKEYNSVLSVINRFGRSSRKCQSDFAKKIESLVVYKNIHNKHRTCSGTQIIDVIKYLGEPSISNIMARIWYSSDVPLLDDEVCLNQIDLSWDSSGNDKITCQSPNFESIDFMNIELETQVKLLGTFLKTIQEAFRKAESNFTHFKESIMMCQREINFIWQKRLVKNYQNSYIFAIHALFLKYIIVESSLRIQMLRSIAKDAKFFILYGYTNLFGKPKMMSHLSDVKLSPVKCKNFTVRLQCYRMNNPEDTMCIMPVKSTIDHEQKISGLISPVQEIQEPNPNNPSTKDSIVPFPYTVDEVQEKFPDVVKFESGDSTSLVPVVQLTSVPSFQGMKFESIGVAVNRLEDLLTTCLKQSLEMIKLPNAALKDNGFLEKEHVDFIDGLVTLISCAVIELHLFTTITWEIINPLQTEYKKSCSYYQKSFKGRKSYSQVIKSNMDKIQSRLDDFIKEVYQGSTSLGNFLDDVTSSSEHFADNSGDASLNQEVLFKFIHNFDLASSFAKQFSCSIWNARWGMDIMGIVLKNELTHENRLFRNLSLEVQLLVLKSLITFFAFVLKTVTSSMSCLKQNSEKAKNYFKSHFIKLARTLLQSQNGRISEVDTREFCFLLQKLKEILNQSKSKIDEITAISANALKNMGEAMNYIKIRFSLESTLQSHERKNKYMCLDDYRPVYKSKMQNFESSLTSRHKCTVGTNVPLKLSLLPH